MLCTLYARDVADDCKIYGPPKTSEFLNSTAFLMHFNLMSYGIHSFFENKNNDILGLRKREDIFKL